ncbi:MAG: peptidoglycan-binding protein, partial [Candidatus Paceibacterota bacterium]
STPAVGTGKTITVVYGLSGANAGSYLAPVNYSTSTGVITHVIVVPTLATSTPTSLSTTSVTLNASIADDGYASSTSVGFNYGTTTSYGSQVSTAGTFGIGSFSKGVTGLTCGTTYHYNAFATNSAGTATTSDQTLTTGSCADITAPNISAVASSTTTTTATITWTTNESASSTVNYGATSSYGNTSTSASFVTSHSITLTGLTASTTYHFQVASSDASGNVATSSDQTFVTAAVDETPTPNTYGTSPIYYTPVTPVVLATTTSTTTNTIVATSTATTTATTTPPSLPNGCLPGYLFNTLTGARCEINSSTPPVLQLTPNNKPITYFVFTKDLSFGQIDSDVKLLQKFFNSHGFLVAKTPKVGSPDHETTFFGQATYNALRKFQRSVGLPASGFFGPRTRAVIAEMMK